VGEIFAKFANRKHSVIPSECNERGNLPYIILIKKKKIATSLMALAMTI
jgi:hypothetical protein